MFSNRSISSLRSSGPSTFLPFFFTLVPLVMISMAVWVISQPLRNWLTGKRTYYALTNKRAIVIKQLFSKQVQSYYDEHIKQMKVRTYANGIGDVIFAEDTVTRQYSSNRNSGLHVNFGDDGVKVGVGPQRRTVTYQVESGFKAVPDACTVEDLISQVFFNEDEKEKNDE